MSDGKTVVSYDPLTDVLYVTYRKEPAARGVETNGIVRRYGLDSQLVGVTILDFADQIRCRGIDAVQQPTPTPPKSSE